MGNNSIRDGRQVVLNGAAASRFASRAARMVAGAMSLATLLVAAPAVAADPPEILTTVTVTASRNPGETPVEAAYTNTVFQRLAKHSRYPTGREASVSCPSGSPAVWVDVARNGKVVGHGIERPSGSTLLDQQARTLASREKYPALPPEAWADGGTHRFLVNYKFDCTSRIKK
jgi:outer membrane biosynthesis protein TonB